MSKKIQVTCHSRSDTQAVGEKIGAILKSHDLVEIIGDVGAGKTTFVQGIAKGIKSDRPATSPTFSVSQVYQGRLKLYHMDLYRLDKPGLVGYEIEEALKEPATAVIIEWSALAEHILPRKRYKIEINVNKDESRSIIIDTPETR